VIDDQPRGDSGSEYRGWCGGLDSPRSLKTRLGLGRDDDEPLRSSAIAFLHPTPESLCRMTDAEPHRPQESQNPQRELRHAPELQGRRNRPPPRSLSVVSGLKGTGGRSIQQ
jgi:hypothetical protein